jgi:hypothetical protein
MAYGWTAGSVPRPTDPTLLQKLDVLERDFPVARVHRRALKELGSEFVYASQVELGYETSDPLQRCC